MNRVYIKTYGCQMNERDSEAVSAMLRNRGYMIVDDEREADILLVNTCSVRDQAEQKAIGKTGQLLKLKRQKPNLVVGILGCMAQNRGERLLDSLPDLDLIVGTQKFHKVPDHLGNIILSLNGQGPVPATIVDLEEEKDSQNTIKDHIFDKKQVSAYVSIMQGCNMACTYCIVPTTRGVERSRPMEAILEEVRMLADKGTKEITLLGQTVTSYGRREIGFKNGRGPFVQLIEAIQNIEGIERIRFTSPHPRGFKKDLIQAYKDFPKLCEYVHLPMQSGSSHILKAMNRPYTVEQYMSIVKELREVCPYIYLSTDVIVGFPGEREEDFEMTKRVFEEVGFDMAYIFKYSPRPGTFAAESMEDTISQEEKERRNQILLSILEKSSLRRNESLVGKVEEVLIEKPAKRGENIFEGKTRGFRKVLFEGNERLVGELMPVYIDRATTSTLYGRLLLKDEDVTAYTPINFINNSTVSNEVLGYTDFINR